MAPVAKKIHLEKPVNGTVLVDDYGWLRERNSPEVRAYLEAENAYAEAMTAGQKGLAEKLYSETLAHIKQTDESVPYRKGGFWYYTRTVEGKQYSVLCRRKGSMSSAEEIVLDENAMAAGEKFFSVGPMDMSIDGNLVAYGVDTVGFRQYRMHVKDLRTGKILADSAERVDAVAWAADNKTLFYVTEDAQTKRPDQVHRHVLGSEITGDAMVFAEKDERYNVNLARTRDDRYLLLGVGSHVTSEARFLSTAKPNDPWTLIEPRKEGVQYFVDEGNDLFYIRVNDTSPNYRVMTTPVAAPGKAHWVEVIPVRSEVPIEDMDVFKSFYVVTERTAGLPTLRVVDLKTKASTAIQFPEVAYTASGQLNPEFDTEKYRYAYQSPITPVSVLEYEVKKGTSTVLKEQETPGYDKKLYAVERIFTRASDGSRVPVAVVYRRDKFRKSENPLFIYAYGSYGITIPDSFNVSHIPLMDRGLVTAVAHIRGGGELGESWHDGGKMMTKRNTFTDFIDATEGLLANGFGKRGSVGIEGASAGGLLMGGVTNMRPDLFKVVLCEVPFVDVMNTMLDATLPLTVSEYEEWGDPNQKAAFDYMRSYSPYDNVTAKAYPAILVQTSFDDSQVMYWEPAKYVAKLRAVKTDKEPLVFFINMHGGHGGSSGRYDRIRETDRRYAFLLSELGVTL